jgi:hypothetical protein
VTDLSTNICLYLTTQALIKEEVEALTREQDNTLHTLKETGLELKAQVADQLTVQQQLMHELNIYAWVIRPHFIVVLGGTVYGFLKFQSRVISATTN